eukprot:1770544-Rhodomonas_salina.1
MSATRCAVLASVWRYAMRSTTCADAVPAVLGEFELVTCPLKDGSSVPVQQIRDAVDQVGRRKGCGFENGARGLMLQRTNGFETTTELTAVKRPQLKDGNRATMLAADKGNIAILRRNCPRLGRHCFHLWTLR